MLRGDAARNRERIVDAACRPIQHQGIHVPLEDIAREAEVGIATLYRRFPTRADLVAAAFEVKISTYRDVVDRAADDPDPWAGVCGLVRELCELQAGDAGLRDMLTMRFPETAEVESARRAIGARLTDLLDRARTAGVVRPDLDATDVGLLLLGNAGVVVKTRDHQPEAWRRYVALTLEALRPRPGSPPLPGRDTRCATPE